MQKRWFACECAYTYNKVKERELEQKLLRTTVVKEQLVLEKEMLNERLDHHIERIKARLPSAR